MVTPLEYQTPGQLARDLKYVDRNFFNSPQLTKEDQQFIRQLITLPNEIKKDSESVLEARKIYQILAVSQPSADSEETQFTTEICNNLSRPYLLPELFDLILSETGSLDIFDRVVKKPVAPDQQEAWNRRQENFCKKFAKKIGCTIPRNMSAKDYVKEHIEDLKTLIEQMGTKTDTPEEIPPEIKALIKGKATEENILKIKEWKEARDAVKLQEKIEHQSQGYIPDTIMLEVYGNYKEILRLGKESPNKVKEYAKIYSQHGCCTSLNLTRCFLTTLPDFFAEFTFLTKLFLSGNQIETIPDFIGGLIRYLYFNSNKVKEVPKAIAALTELQGLDLSENEIETIPDFIGGFTGLRSIYLRSNKVKEVPEAIAALTQLETLDLSENEIETVPDFIGGFTELRSLYLSSNKVREVPEAIATLTQLETLDLSGNQIDSKVLERLRQLLTNTRIIL